MAKTRTLPDKYYDKDYETNGIHRVPLFPDIRINLLQPLPDVHELCQFLSTGLCWRWHGHGIQLYHGYAYLGRRN